MTLSGGVLYFPFLSSAQDINSGKVYKIYMDSQVEGINKDAFIINRIPAKILTLKSHHSNRSKSTGLPSSNFRYSFLGCPQGAPEYEEISVFVNCTEAGEK